MALTFMQEIEIHSALATYGLTVSEIQEIIDILNSGDRNKINRIFSMHAPRIRNSDAFRKNVNYLKQFI